MSSAAGQCGPQVRSDASDSKAMARPSAEIAGCALRPFAVPRRALRLTRVTAEVSRSTQKSWPC